MLDIARRIIELTGLSSEIVFKSPTMDDSWHRQPDMALLEAPGWSPTTSLDNGLLRTAQRLRGVIEAMQVRNAPCRPAIASTPGHSIEMRLAPR
ncbi:MULTISPECIES: hypothetical protein [unclassified Caballeronia]|uniref:hypothetical protein n=1 Tax=unclassified Caballeronia TaxID=2646786 RepID=UPI001F364EF8|nr:MULTISPECIES: hypothetical protein [unclassified Caballeronia]MCE4547450.1 hypothetical protein [Caballeronia sp. PC1]MCE4575436.1 hypothetical protein [Caballeronia sp. CLC5]